MDNDALSGLLNDPEALQNALRSVSSLLGASDADGAPETPPLSPLLPSLPRLDRDALITLAAAFFLLTDGDRGTDWESVILAGILLFLGF